MAIDRGEVEGHSTSLLAISILPSDKGESLEYKYPLDGNSTISVGNLKLAIVFIC
jgi:hypothetical protein